MQREAPSGTFTVVTAPGSTWNAVALVKLGTLFVRTMFVRLGPHVLTFTGLPPGGGSGGPPSGLGPACANASVAVAASAAAVRPPALQIALLRNMPRVMSPFLVLSVC